MRFRRKRITQGEKKRHRDHGYGFFLKGYHNININQLATGS